MQDAASGTGVFRSAWIFSVVVTLLVAAVGIYFVFQRGEVGLGTTGTTGVGTGGPGVTVTPAGGAPTGGDTGGAVNLFANPQPAWDAFAGLPGGPRIYEITLYDTYALIDVQSAAEPEFVDAYEYRDGGLSGPEDAIAIMVEGEVLDASYFELAEIPPTVIPELVAQACQGNGFVIQHVTITQVDAFEAQPQPLIRVYSGNPERRGSGGYITFTPDGTAVANYCD